MNYKIKPACYFFVFQNNNGPLGQKDFLVFNSDFYRYKHSVGSKKMTNRKRYFCIYKLNNTKTYLGSAIKLTQINKYLSLRSPFFQNVVPYRK